MNLKPIQQLLETEMDRREFLTYLGVCILAVTGISGIIASIASPTKRSAPPIKGGYGSSSYGE